MSTAVSPNAQQTCKALIGSLLVAAERADDASDAFDAVLMNTPSGVPHPDEVQRIKDASQELFRALKKRMKADVQLHAFLEREIGSAHLAALRNGDSTISDEFHFDTSWA